VLVIDKVQNEFQAIVDELPSAGHKLSRLLSERLHTAAQRAAAHPGRRVRTAASHCRRTGKRAARRAAAAAASEASR
jgi:hypothetical protein